MRQLSIAVVLVLALVGLHAEVQADPVPPADAKQARRSPLPGVSRPVPTGHPRILGSRDDLQALARSRPELYERVKSVATKGEIWLEKAALPGLVYAVEGDAKVGRGAVDFALALIGEGVQGGHQPFGGRVAACAIAYDLCYDLWTESERKRFIDYFNATVDKNRGNEDWPFHDAYWGYKNFGYGIAAYATWYENPRSPQILADLEHDYMLRGAPVLREACAGGAWVEGYYDKWNFSWLLMMEVAKRCDGADWYATAEEHWRHRAATIMFENYPGIGEYGTRMPIPNGDSGGRVFGADRDSHRGALMILAGHYAGDRDARAAASYLDQVPRPGRGQGVWMDFLFWPVAVERLPLSEFRRSHVATGVGNVYARSSWQEDATHFFFQCGDRFTSHQHLHVGNFNIFKHAKLVEEDGEYVAGDGWNGPHGVNYLQRSIAHNTVLVKDPAEKWPDMRAAKVRANDGGQHYDFPSHNGLAKSMEQVKPGSVWDTGELLAFDDTGDYVYMAGDCTRAYSAKKMERFVREIVFLRPGTFVVRDRVVTKDPAFKKTWVLHVTEVPKEKDGVLVVTHNGYDGGGHKLGTGRLFVRPLLPERRSVELFHGSRLYEVDGKTYPPGGHQGDYARCRIEISPAEAAAEDDFVTVLRATGPDDDRAPDASVRREGGRLLVTVDGTEIAFHAGRVGGSVGKNALADAIVPPEPGFAAAAPKRAARQAPQRTQASEDSLARYRAQLRQRAREAAASTRPPRFAYSVVGDVVELVAGGDGKLVLRIPSSGASMNFDLERPLASADERALALAVVRKGEPADHALAAFFLLQGGEAVEADLHLKRAGEHADAVRAAFAPAASSDGAAAAQ